MRIRSTKPEFWRSERVASVDWSARLVLKGLESYVDDNGVGKDDLALIVADVFPRDLTREPSRTLASVSEALNTLSAAGLLWRFEVDGTPLLYIAFWESIQRIDRPSKGRFPRPDGTWEYGESQIRESIASPREDVASPRPRNRGTGEQGNRREKPDYSADFDAFWTAYPRKQDKKKAGEKYTAARKDTDADTILSGCRAYAAQRSGQDPNFTKLATTWLNGKCWEDEATAVPTIPNDGRMEKFW